MAHEHDIDSTVRVYITVFVALLVLTVMTVAVSYLHLETHAAISVALAIASVKGALVVCFFMHLIDERKLIYAVMALTVLFFIFEIFVPLITQVNSFEV